MATNFFVFDCLEPEIILSANSEFVSYYNFIDRHFPLHGGEVVHSHVRQILFADTSKLYQIESSATLQKSKTALYIQSSTHVIYNDNGKSYPIIGSKTEISKRLKALTELRSEYVGKVVLFNYNGGSKPGERRVVKVEDVYTNHFVGKDVSNDEFRSYLVEKIPGGWSGIEILA